MPFSRNRPRRDNGQHIAKYNAATNGYTTIGSNVTLTMSCPARVSSTKPMMAAIEVFLIYWTSQPTVGGMEIRFAWGRMT